jgi:hypothetical protein
MIRDTGSRLRAGTGISVEQDAKIAGRQAAMAALGELEGAEPALVIVYAAVKYDLVSLLGAVRSVTGSAPLVGATTAGHFASGRLVKGKSGVAVLAMTSGPYRFGVASAADIGNDLDAAGQALARASRAAAGSTLPNGAVLLLADGLVGDHQQLVKGIYRVTGPGIPTVGGAAGDDWRMTDTFVFHDDRVLEHGAVAVWIASEDPGAVAVGHGWSAASVPMLVTRAEGTQIIEIAGRPAGEVYAEVLNCGEQPKAGGAASGDPVLHPLGLLQPDGSVVIRIPTFHGVDQPLRTFAPVPAGCAIQVMSGSPESLLEQIPVVARAALRGCRDPGVLLAFSCCSRYLSLGERISEEPPLIQAAVEGVPTFGFYTYGEFARCNGVLGLHNATLTALAL